MIDQKKFQFAAAEFIANQATEATIKAAKLEQEAKIKLAQAKKELDAAIKSAVIKHGDYGNFFVFQQNQPRFFREEDGKVSAYEANGKLSQAEVAPARAPICIR